MEKNDKLHRNREKETTMTMTSWKNALTIAASTQYIHITYIHITYIAIQLQHIYNEKEKGKCKDRVCVNGHICMESDDSNERDIESIT